ncbi:putative olfactory receptor 52P1 [Canis lupus familiaris]|uniref:olfactory receptor 52P1-like n=1 Tax=Canis lupus dingo TaxID=286419 RepID=UPI00005A96E4|nr:olfactory receptor 52P1-like [Canis lupus dingo]XP_038285504.1 putative olfactory receptor 52P1 [Canis lupus familiaris]XP_038424089.1 putative olfactory receptor 52P1 [Canis lupus familiaris]|eukprot:XP_851470.1 putative olfactory receptor 52P1 [Canis lupus familiaris]
MADNATHSYISSFFLVGIPGLQAFHCWIGIPVCLLFALALLGNSVIIITIKIEPSLHLPVYFFLCMLAVNDMALVSSTAPKMLGIFWLDAHKFDFSICLAQMYFIHTFCIIESALLVAMAFDRYVAICIPLRYTTIVTTPMITKMGLAGVIRATFMVLPCPLLIKRLPYYTKYVINHAYCEHMAVVKLASANTLINRAYGISVALSVMVLDLGLIATSYIKILQAVFRLSSQNARSKALGTCAAHVCTLLGFYTPALFSFLTHRIGKKVPSSIHIIFASLYLLVPPTVNPLVYGVKTKQIRDRVVSLFLSNKIISGN